MPDKKKPDPFKPQQPSIPGVSPSTETRAHETAETPQRGEPSQPSSPKTLAWVIAAVVVAVIIVGVALFKMRSSSAKTEQPVADASVVVPPIDRTAANPAETPPTAPGPVATTEEMAKLWSAKRFMFRDPVTNQPVPAMVVRLPRGDYWGFSLRAPFGTCELEYVTDLEMLQKKYQFRAEHPMVIDPCNQTIYDLLRYGSGASNDSLVRGEMAQGPGIRPPIAIEIRTQGEQVIAERME
jgi:hypothetical protein